MPKIPLNREAILVSVAVVGTTITPWGLAFIQSYAVEKRLQIKDLRYEHIDVITSSVLGGVIGLFIVVACAATLHVEGITIHDAGDAARALEPLAGSVASTLFALSLLGAALLAAAIVPLSTAYSISEASGARADLNDTFTEARRFYCSYGTAVIVAAILVLIPGAPLIPILFLSQTLNAVLLLVPLPFMCRLGRDPAVIDENALGPVGRVTTAIVLCTGRGLDRRPRGPVGLLNRLGRILRATPTDLLGLQRRPRDPVGAHRRGSCLLMPALGFK